MNFYNQIYFGGINDVFKTYQSVKKNNLKELITKKRKQLTYNTLK